MTDLMFLLLLFLLIATTLINPNALKLMLPKSSNMLKDKAVTTVSIQDTGHGKYRYYVELQDVGSVEGVERALKSRLDGQKEPTVSLHADKTVAWWLCLTMRISPKTIRQHSFPVSQKNILQEKQKIIKKLLTMQYDGVIIQTVEQPFK